MRSAEGLSPHREISPRSDMAALPQQGAAPLAPLRGYPCTPTKTVHPPLASVPFLRVLSGEKAPTFHKLLFVYAEDTSAEVLRAAMLQKGFDLILVSSIWEAKRRIFEDKEIELILCDLELPDGTAMELFHTLRRVAGMFQMKNPPVRLLPFFILTENNDLATEYEYRHEGVNDYITAPVNIPELIRQVLFFVE